MFREEIAEHAKRAAELPEAYPGIKTSEAQTKNSLIEPFLRCLGYDPSHPEQVALEVSTELGGKIDYVLTGQANVKIAVEAKKAGAKLSEKETNQLRSYFTFSEAVAAILTNGVDYWLFTDLEKTNVMDAEPYHRVAVTQLTHNDIHHLETLARSHLQQEVVHQQAQRERYRKQVDEIVTQELKSPSHEFLRLIGKKAGIKPLTKAALEALQPLVAEAIKHVTKPLAPLRTDAQSSPQPQGTSPTDNTPVDSPPLTAGQKAAVTLKKFKGATLFGKSLPVKNYTQLLIEVAKELRTRHLDRFAELVEQAPFFKSDRKWQWVSVNKADIYPESPTRMVGDSFFDVGMSAKDKKKRADLLLKGLGYDPAKVLEIHVTDS